MKLKLLIYLLIGIGTAYSGNIKLGTDILIDDNFRELNNKRVALLTNFSGRTSDGQLTVDAFLKQNVCKLELILTPEHGLYTTVPAGIKVGDTDYKGIEVHSLYGTSRNPNESKFANIDVIVVDLQDIGVRSYTYLSTMFNTMELAAKLKKEVLILDRPNPLGGNIVDGAVADVNKLSFVSIIPISYIHGCTLGELAMMINSENWLPSQKKCDLKVIKMKGWKRNMTWEETGLYWFPTSPNVPSIQAVRGLANLGIIGELGVVSIGIGTTSPFQYLGLITNKQNKFLNALQLNGVILHKTYYRPFFGMYSGKDVLGYYLQFEPENMEPFTNSIKILHSLREDFPELFAGESIKESSISMFNKVTASTEILTSILNGDGQQTVLKIANHNLSQFIKLRNKYLIYE